MREDPDMEIAAENLIVRYGRTIALDNLSFQIRPGTVGLLGPNGAGKSTFIKTLLGLVEPNGGSITVGGLDPRDDLMRVRDLVGYMPEHPCLIDEVNAVNLVSYMGEISGVKSATSIQRAHEVLDFVGIGEERYRDIGSYSTGMKQRIKLAQALTHDPPVLLLDEPTNGMDPAGREEMLSLIEDIGRADKMILVSSHVLPEVERVCERVLIIHRGKLRQQGSVEELTRAMEGRYKIEIRGESQKLDNFLVELGNEYEIISKRAGAKRLEIVVDGLKDGGDVLRLVAGKPVQIRSVMKNKAALEDTFMKSIGGD